MPARAAAALLLIATADLCRADGPDDVRPVVVRVLGGEVGRPLNGVALSAFRSTGNYTDDKRTPTTRAVTDRTGRARLPLAPGRYYVELTSAKEVPYLRLPVAFEAIPSHHDWVIDVEAGGRRAFEFRLADACRLTLKAVDADTKVPLAGVTFVTENAAGEYWATPVAGHNLGANPESEETAEAGPDGTLTRLVGPHEGFTYYVWPRPEGYEPVGPFEVEVPTPAGTATAGHVFEFRKARP